MIDKQLLSLLGQNKKYIFYTVTIMILKLIANIGATASICALIWCLINDVQPIYYLMYSLTGAICIAFKYFATIKSEKYKDEMGRAVKKDLRLRTYNKMIKLGVNVTDNVSMSALTQMSVEGIEQLDLYYSSYIPQFFYAMIAPLVLFLVTIWFDWRVSLVLLLCVPLIPISIIAVSKYAKKVFAKYWDKYTSMGDVFLDSVQGLKELKIFKADKRQHERLNKSAEEFRKITMKVLIMQLASTTIMDLVAYGGAGLGIAVAITGLLHRNVPVIHTLFLILVAVDFFLPLRAFGSAFHIAMNGATAGKKIMELLNTPEPVWGSDDVNGTELKVNDVTFSYNENRNVLKNVNMVFPEHSMSAIVGESGCGKSTIVNLLLGSIKPKSGTVTVGGKKVETLSREKYYSHISSINYNTYIFNETIRDNFKLINKNVTDEEIFKALKQVNLDKFVLENGGLDKVISEDAENISGGQRQRLALAINLISNKDIYIFDEATSNIDIESETIIMNVIKNLSKTKTVIVISHRLENVVNSDNIYFMKNGEVKESGKHQALLNLKGGYASLYKAQKNLEDGYNMEATI